MPKTLLQLSCRRALALVLLLLVVSCSFTHYANTGSNTLTSSETVSSLATDIAEISLPMSSATPHAQCIIDDQCLTDASLSATLTLAGALGVFMLLFTSPWLITFLMGRLLYYATRTNRVHVFQRNYPRRHSLFCCWLN